MIGVAIVVTLTPGLKALARRMDWGSGGPWGGAEVFSGELMSTAWEVVADWSGRRQEFMVPAILTAIRKRLIRRTQAWRRETDRRTDWSIIAEPEGSSESIIDELARVLENAADQLISRGDASLVYAHRVLGLSMVELAKMTGQSRNALHHRATRAERRLCA
jgi:DNA-directed RNA polymerase specialized sigma24 family protein